MACGAVAIVADVDLLRDLVAPEAVFDPSSSAADQCLDRTRPRATRRFREAARRHRPGHATPGETSRIGRRLSTKSCSPDPAVPGTVVVASRSSRRSRPLPLGSPTTASVSSRSSRLLADLDIDCFADGLEFSPRVAKRAAGACTSTTPGAFSVSRRQRRLRRHRLRARQRRVPLGRTGVAPPPKRDRPGPRREVEWPLPLRRQLGDGRAGRACRLVRRIYGPLLPDRPASPGDLTTAARPEHHGLLMAREIIALADRFLVTSAGMPPAWRTSRRDPDFATASKSWALPPRASPARAVRLAGVPSIEPGARVLASFGIVDPIKQPDKVLGCFTALSAKHQDLVMAFVGPISTDLADSEFDEQADDHAGMIGIFFRSIGEGAWKNRQELRMSRKCLEAGQNCYWKELWPQQGGVRFNETGASCVSMRQGTGSFASLSGIITIARPLVY